jgi:hypothetical protein
MVACGPTARITSAAMFLRILCSWICYWIGDAVSWTIEPISHQAKR